MQESPKQKAQAFQFFEAETTGNWYSLSAETATTKGIVEIVADMLPSF